ncbi:unnamed protein product [Clonostachys rosea]|uniref:Major facilitator superfamily (MFS) profile domain-containing protein n=1 Tax=Bionectria ochroleuca TaxID=29856 RepID=A0ABY6UC27_BIOOC|nr:unnamed protein product [Clonostachys rosea]
MEKKISSDARVATATVVNDSIDNVEVQFEETHAERAAALLASHHHGGALADASIPTPQDLVTLRRVPGRMPLKLFTVAFVELCERFSYYGTTIVFTNFIQHPLPFGSSTGADNVQPGALGMGQRVSTSVTTANQFWQCCSPLLGAWIADKYWGRYKTICVALLINIVGHLILTMSAIPPVITNQAGSISCLVIGIVVLGIGTGGFKPNINPLLVEQLGEQHLHVRILKSGERVIVDPAITIERAYNWFYLFINIESITGQVTMVYAEKYVGFWLSFTLPTFMLCICPLVMLWGRKRYQRRDPGGSTLGLAFKTFALAQRGRWSLNPWSTILPENRPVWMTFDDAWVDELRRGFKACGVFMRYPLFWLCYIQLSNNLVSQAAVLTRNGVPNDIILVLKPISLILFIIICDQGLYPTLRKLNVRFTPIKKITCGFYAGSASMLWSAVVQYYIYRKSECGWYASGKTCAPAPISVWVQTGSYVFMALAEVFGSITSLEYAYSKAPKNMRSMVQAVGLFMTAFAAAIGQAFVGLSADPLLVWNFGLISILAFIGGTGFWFQFRNLDKEEDELNELPEGFVGNQGDNVEKTA